MHRDEGAGLGDL